MTVTNTTPTGDIRPKECSVTPAVEGPPAIDESLPGPEDVKMQGQPMEQVTDSPVSKNALTTATIREGPLIDEPLPGLEEDVKMQEQSVADESVQSKSVPSAFHSQTRNNLISVSQRNRNSNNSAQLCRLDRARAAAGLFTRAKRNTVWTRYL